ncbi:TetR/AcrR family transcriptional regulator [Nocardiopsis trehalosi]|uniref:TetR/AcrR family transcriptional regulator n=1 Tax=Nocardiopsis trehalosi TaxID=109329 RepID=UPI00082A8FE7|nr:TetR/AcrR family transcriptional regulator [Nocardiopsis trehalosi]
MPRAGLTADRVTAAAADLADRVGFDNVTLSALARGFGVKDASLYFHVRNLRELRERVAVLAVGEQTDRIAVAVAGRAGRDALAGFAGAYRAYALEHPGRYAATQLRIGDHPLTASPAHRRSAELMVAVMRGYALADPDLTDAVRLLRATVHGYIDLEATGQFLHERDVEASWERIVDALHATFSAWRTGAVGGG